MVLGYFIIQFLQLILTEWSFHPIRALSARAYQRPRLKDELKNPVLTGKSKIIRKLDFVLERFSPKGEGFSQNRVCIF